MTNFRCIDCGYIFNTDSLDSECPKCGSKDLLRDILVCKQCKCTIRSS